MSKSTHHQLISIIIPIRNEAHNIPTLITSLMNFRLPAHTRVEIIAVDDYSTDNSFSVLQDLTGQYKPGVKGSKKYRSLTVHRKKGIIGKGAALLEGIAESSGDVIVTIDADLSYPPEAIPLLLKEIEDGADVVVGSRNFNGEKLSISHIISNMAASIIGRLFFGLDFDYQSGLKAMRRVVVQSLQLQPSKWSFDLELIQKAIHSAFKTVVVDIIHTNRRKGNDQLNPIQVVFELFTMSILLKISLLHPVHIENGPEHNVDLGWKRKRYKPYTRLHHEESAIRVVTIPQIVLAILLLFIVVWLFILSWQTALIFIISVMTIMYFSDLLFHLFLIIRSLQNSPEVQISKRQITAFTRQLSSNGSSISSRSQKLAQWPLYTIICPLYKEWQVVPQFVEAMQQLDYPKDRLQVILSLEEDDTETQKQIAAMKLPDYFMVLVTPHHMPKTKPKACNYALVHAQGEYIVIYDAEDIPDYDQLKKAVIAFTGFEEAGEPVVCIQSKLNFYNIRQNLLTRLFTLEYSLWFDLVLTGLHSINAPIPLGGTSNHFKKEYLDLLQGWDPFNVTEDCDLGIRLFKYGYQTKVLDSTTWEEANSSFWGWFPQRTRWIKGYIQTYLVHMRRPHEFITDWKNPHLLTFQLIVGGKVLSMWINPLLWLLTVVYFSFRPVVGDYIESLYLTPIFYLGIFSLVFGNFLYFYYYMIGAAKRELWDLVKYAFLVPVYWLMMSVASWLALWQIVIKPHHWDKTTHGLHIGKHDIRIVGGNVV